MESRTRRWEILQNPLEVLLATVRDKCREVLIQAEGLGFVLPRPKAERLHEFCEGSGEEGGTWKIELFQFCGYLIGVSIWLSI